MISVERPAALHFPPHENHMEHHGGQIDHHVHSDQTSSHHQDPHTVPRWHGHLVLVLTSDSLRSITHTQVSPKGSETGESLHNLELS